MAAQPEPPTAAGRQRAGRPAARPAKLSREGIIDGALTFLDREGWDALTINALATQLGTKGPSLYNHVDSLEDLRRAVRIRVIDDIITMLNRVGEGRARDDAVLVMAGAYRSYAHHHPGRYSAFTRMPLGGDDPGVHRRHLRRGRTGDLGAVLLRAGRRGGVPRRAGVLVRPARLRAAGDDRRDGRHRHRRLVLRHGAEAGGGSGTAHRARLVRRFDLRDRRRVLWFLVPGGLRRLTVRK